MNRRPAVFSIIYVLSIALVFDMVIDYDRPQTGLIRVPLAPLQWQLDAMHLIRRDVVSVDGSTLYVPAETKLFGYAQITLLSGP